MDSTQKTYRIGVDIGGTFTDIVLIGDDGSVLTQKVPSTSDDYAQGIFDGLKLIHSKDAVPTASYIEVVHGTTVATNTILERKGALTGLITTSGFRDVLEIGRLRYPRLYDLTWERPPALVPRRLRREVEERIGAKGEVVHALDVDGARETIRRLLAQGIESLAICLINAYANPIHEHQLREVIDELAPDLPVSLSCEVLPEIKEYERTSTTVINATLQPIVSRYLHRLSEGFDDSGSVSPPFYVMQSNGGIMSAPAAADKPIHIIESGPAAGVIAALALGERVGLTNILTLDMGGTTAKTSLIEDGKMTRSPEYQIGGGVSVGTRLSRGGGYPLRVPAIDIAEVGAGGGSIVSVDGGGSLRVGPQSAGAIPGPVCYALGGEEPTLTDANVVLGYLNPEYLAGGELPLNAEQAHRVLHDKIAVPLDLSLHEVAYGIHQIAAANMGRAARAVSLERGRDPRQFVLCAFGGNGPVHATELAQSLGIKRILIPPCPGLFSAFGLLFADIAHHSMQTYKRQLAELHVGDLIRMFRQMETDAQAELADNTQTEFSHSRTIAPQSTGAILQRAIDVRYTGQSSELTLPIEEADFWEAQFTRRFGERFAGEHERTYGHRAPDDPVEIVNLRLTALISNSTSHILASRGGDLSAPSTRQNRRCYFGAETGWLEVPVLSRDALGDTPEKGPLIVEEYDTTILIPPHHAAARDEWENVIIENSD